MEYKMKKPAKKPKDWPANAIECQLDNIHIQIERFKKEPNYKNKEAMASIILIIASIGGMIIRVFISYPIKVGEKRIYLETMEEILSNNNKTIIDSKIKNIMPLLQNNK